MRRSKALFAGKIAIPKRLLILVVGPVYRDIELKVVECGECFLYSSSLWRTAAIVWDGGNIND